MDLQKRIEKLERDSYRIKLSGLTILTLAILACFAGAARKNCSAFDWVSADGFTLRDESNTRDRGGLAYEPKIGPYFYLKDKEGYTKVKITLEGATRSDR